MESGKKILLIEPFFGGSHRQWAEGLARYSSHQVEILSLPARHWKWRMHGGAVALAEEFLTSKMVPDIMLATDMLDLSTFLALTRTRTSQIPVALYFHENQITYPWSSDDRDPALQRDHHYGFINYTSALAADQVFFNSAYHQQSFLKALPAFLRQFPDKKGLATLKAIEKKSSILPLGLELSKFRPFLPPKTPNASPIILWNHRWEYDKNPETFFETLFQLQEEGLDFQLVVLGESYGKVPEIFDLARQKLAERIIHWGYVGNFPAYAKWLARADILPVTSNQDFFGASVVEAIFCGCFPLLPDRLVYKEHIPGHLHPDCIYQAQGDLYRKLRRLLKKTLPTETTDLANFVQKYDWESIISAYDQAIFP